MTKQKESNLLTVIPKNLIQGNKSQQVIEAISNSESKLYQKTNNSVLTWNLENQNEAVIWNLLWEHHLIKRSEGLVLATTKKEMINLIESSVTLHIHKGTPYAVERALEAVGLIGKIEEWFDYDGEKYSFMIELILNQKLSDLKLITEMVMEYKNERSYFGGFSIALMRDREVSIILSNDSYTYPVFYKDTGWFSGTAEFFHAEAGKITMSDDSYNYDVIYPVNKVKVFYFDDVKTIATEDSYGYIKEFETCGEMELLHAETSYLTDDRLLTYQNGYEFEKTFKTTGDFYCGEEW